MCKAPCALNRPLHYNRREKVHSVASVGKVFTESGQMCGSANSIMNIRKIKTLWDIKYCLSAAELAPEIVERKGALSSLALLTLILHNPLDQHSHNALPQPAFNWHKSTINYSDVTYNKPYPGTPGLTKQVRQSIKVEAQLNGFGCKLESEIINNQANSQLPMMIIPKEALASLQTVAEREYESDPAEAHSLSVWYTQSRKPIVLQVKEAGWPLNALYPQANVMTLYWSHEIYIVLCYDYLTLASWSANLRHKTFWCYISLEDNRGMYAGTNWFY